LHTWRILRSIHARPKDLFLAWAPDSQRIACAGEAISIWDVSSRSIAHPYITHCAAPLAVQ
jgi:hypothetical protein